MKVLGEEKNVERAQQVLSQLTELSRRGNTIQEQNVDYALSLTMEDSAEDILTIDKDLICHTLQGKPIKPKTLGQKKYVDAIREKMITFGLWPLPEPVKLIWRWQWQSRRSNAMKWGVSF